MDCISKPREGIWRLVNSSNLQGAISLSSLGEIITLSTGNLDCPLATKRGESKFVSVSNSPVGKLGVSSPNCLTCQDHCPFYNPNLNNFKKNGYN
jgi:hypothetical protein